MEIADATKYKQQVEDFIEMTAEGRAASELARDFYHGRQWTRDEEAELLRRKQAPIVKNRIKPKVAGLKGLLIQQRTDPKAYPRTQKHEKAALAITDALRFVADNTDFDETKQQVAEDFIVEGYGGALVGIQQQGEDTEIEITPIPWDRVYFDPHSRKKDFSDARYMGVIVWMDQVEAQSKFGEIAEDLLAQDGEGETFDDRPRWIDGSSDRKRLRVAQHFYIEKGAWNTCTFSGDTYLVDPVPSPFLDENGEPSNPIELVSAYVDRESNRRFGEVEFWIDLQREINKRSSKALHLMSVRQTSGRRGSIEDIPALKRELAKPDGHVEYDGDRGDFEILPTGDMGAAQFELLQDAKAEIDAVGFNAQLAGERQGNLSGKAIISLQNAGANELTDLFSLLNGWEKRIYRQIWNRVRQFWTQEKWIRVTDNQNSLRWVGFNIQMTAGERLQEMAQDESIGEQERTLAAQTLQAMVEVNDPRLEQFVDVQNDVASIDVDIILDQSLDSINVQSEQFEMLANLATNRPEVPFTALLRLSTLRDKDDLIKSIEEREAAQAQILEAQAEQMQQSAMAAAQIEVEKDRGRIVAETQSKLAVEKQRSDSERQMLLAKLEYDQQITQFQRESDQERIALETESKLAVDRQRIESEQQIAIAKLAFERGKSEIAVNAEREVAGAIEVPAADRLASAIDSLAQARQGTQDIDALIVELRRPLTIERDEQGRAIAVV